MAKNLFHIVLITLTAIMIGGCKTTSLSGTKAYRGTGPVAVQREFRAAWIATVANIDWPSRKDLTSDQQKAELVAMMDKAAELNLNAIVLQVRPHADALYPSSIEPWSEYLTGKAGRAPDPMYDPLAFAVDEAHKRGLELHAWFNPYRAWHPSAKSEIPDNHLSKTHPNLVKKYGAYLWMDPGEKQVQQISLDVVMDVVKRYDIDGVHFDDYFYPYPISENGKRVDFPDEPSWQAYLAGGGTLSRADWRRDNVNRFMRDLYGLIKAEKPWVMLGISPFGIWKPGHPAQIKGFNQYEDLYADAKLWLEKGWCDYFTPQLYWPIAPPDQSFVALLQWWADHNPKGRHLWPGMSVYRIGDGSAKSVPPMEIIHQIQWTRIIDGANGNVFFSFKVFMENRLDINDLLLERVYRDKALVPASPWVDEDAPAAPTIAVTRQGDGWRVNIQDGDLERTRTWVIYQQRGERWQTTIVPAGTRQAAIAGDAVAVQVTAVGRSGLESKPATWRKADAKLARD